MSDIFAIKRPLVSEKAADLNKMGKYVFLVKKDATKAEIKKAVKEIYRVAPLSVNIINRPSKPKRFRMKTGKQPGLKKAVVTLREGEKIDVT